MQQLKSDSCIVAVVFVRQNGMAWLRDLHTFSSTKRGVVSILLYFVVDWSLYITNWTGSLEHEAHGAAVWKSSCEDLADFFSLLGHCDTNQRNLSASHLIAATLLCSCGLYSLCVVKPLAARGFTTTWAQVQLHVMWALILVKPLALGFTYHKLHRTNT
jgi:hypothetical protein